MKLSEIKEVLATLDEVRFVQPDGNYVPRHFHVTEVGKIDKHFIDCGGTMRNESVISFQLWVSDDYDHRISAQKLRAIIALSEKALNLQDAEIEVEYQAETIGKYRLEFDGSDFILATKQTDCLAKDTCGIPQSRPKVKLSQLTPEVGACCEPGGNCC